MTATAMAREIAEQPEAVRRTLAAHLSRTDEIAALATGRRVLFVSRGSSDNAASYGRYLLEAYAARPAALAAPSVYTAYRSGLDLRDTLVVSVSQSGATQEIVEAQDWVRDCGAATLAVTNDADSPLAAGADLALVTEAGPELAVPATKSYLTQVAAMAVIGYAVSPATGAERAAWRRELDAAPDEIERLVMTRTGIDDAVAMLAGSDAVIASARGLLLGTALEAALKLEETCLRPVRGLSYADLRHGPVAVVGSGVTALVLAAADGPLADALADQAADLVVRGAHVIGVGGNDRFAAAATLSLAGPRLGERTAPLGTIVPAQLVVEALARHLGLDPDAPRGLRKVTQTELVH